MPEQTWRLGDRLTDLETGGQKVFREDFSRDFLSFFFPLASDLHPLSSIAAAVPHPLSFSLLSSRKILCF